MCNVKTVKANQFIPKIMELLEQGISVRISVTGMSMYPFLHEFRDSVLLKFTDYSGIHRGDIVLIVRDNGEYILHRVIKKRKNSFFIVGDGQVTIEGPIFPRQLLAKVDMAWRNNRPIKCNCLRARLYSAIWFLLRPYRKILIRLINLFCKISLLSFKGGNV